MKTTTNRVPVHLPNPKSEPITLYAGTEVATLEIVEIPTENVSAVKNVNVNVVREQVQAMLGELVEKAGPGLHQVKNIFHLLVSFANIFAKFTAGLGWTDMIRHMIRSGCKRAEPEQAHTMAGVTVIWYSGDLLLCAPAQYQITGEMISCDTISPDHCVVW